MTYHRSLLPNGLRVITVPMPSFESATALVMVGAGARYEQRNNNGISHFLEHMPFKGTTSKPSPMAIASILDGIGGEWNAFTGKETTAYYVKSQATHIETSLDLLSDLLQNSLFDPKEIEKEKGVIIEEINMYEDMPMRKIGDIYEELLYGDTPMGWDVAGTKEVIRSVTRDMFISYMNSLYSADNMTVIVAGGVDVKKAEELVAKYFGTFKTFNTITSATVDDTQTKPQVLLKYKKTEQVHLALGVRTVGINHPDRYPLDVLAGVLGAGTSSRLFNEVREKRGLAYYVRASSENYTDVGTLVATAGVDPKKTKEAIRVIAQELGNVAKNGNIQKEEFERAKELLKGHFVLDLEDSKSVATFYAHQELLENVLDNPKEVLEKIDAVTLEQVEGVAKKYIQQDQLNLALIGNFSEKDNFEELLKFT